MIFIVIPGLVAGTHGSACKMFWECKDESEFAICGTMGPRNESRDDTVSATTVAEW